MNSAAQDRGRSITAFSLIGLGVLFLLSQIFGFSLFSLLWPLFVIIPGAAFLYFAITGDKKMAGLAVPGTVITGTGLILLFQSITGYWQSWAYAWTLYPLFVGLALTFMGQRPGMKGRIKPGTDWCAAVVLPSLPQPLSSNCLSLVVVVSWAVWRSRCC
jgi:hypothetical protein